MTRVLQLLGRSAGGIARHVAQVTEALDGHEGLHLDIAGPMGLPISMPKQLIEVYIPDGPLKGHRTAIRKLTHLMRSYDVVHAHGLRAGMDAGIASRRAGKRSLLTVHNLVRAEIAGRKAILYRRAESAAVRATHHTFTVSQDIARHLKSSVPGCAEKIEVMYLGVGQAPSVSRSRDEVRSSLMMAPATSLVVSVARLAPQKSLEVLFTAVRAMGSDVEVAVIGEGPLRMDLERHVRGLALTDRVHFLGFRDDVADYVAAADAFCLSSIWEGIPLAAQEAILLGIPVVATDVGGMRELISNKVSGRLVPPNDPVSLASALKEVLGDRERAQGYAHSASQALKDRFSTDRMLARLVKAYASR